MHSVLPHKISVLVFLQNTRGELLLIERAKSPNAGLWSPPGGKLDTGIGESPHECAAREIAEEVGVRFTPGDFHLFAMVAERAYEGGGHWLMFLFDGRRTVDALPAAIDEGRFGFFTRAAIDALPLPDTDRIGLWPVYDRHRTDFVALRTDCTPGRPPEFLVDEIMAAHGTGSAAPTGGPRVST